MNKKQEATWRVKDLYEYAVHQYELLNRLSKKGGNALSDTDRSAIERAIRRRLEKNNLVHKHKYIEQKTGKEKEKYEYTITQKLGQYLIDFLMEDYFTKIVSDNDPEMEKMFLEMDEKLNYESIEKYEELIEEHNNNSDSTPFPIEHMQCEIDRFMLRAIFNLYFNFNEKEYVEDSKNRFEQYDSNSSVNCYDDGYSKTDYKLKHPIESYCKRKTTKRV